MLNGNDMNIVLSSLEPNDITIIREWEPYPAEFSELDYALREGGWLDEFHPIRIHTFLRQNWRMKL
jgi:hypothetical protein